ncbi:PucR family transcriptional regulator ligand-binding domain-containing protein [Rhodococcus sp. NPDC079359]|uniref:PucR family transcriptional regulator n=1 Tax=Rhodococcus sp. NPDC079359 TaxID=3154961 RepID=UPI00344C19DD
MTVRRLTEFDELGLALVSGFDGADRVIEWAHAIELGDPAPWLSGGELVMTTGMRIGKTQEEQFGYVERLFDAGVVALAFDTGTNYDSVPAGVLAASDSLGLPVLAVPASTPFVAITRAVIDDLTADQVRGFQRVVDQQDVLARATLRGGIVMVVSALSRALSSPVALIDTDSRILAVHGHDSAAVVEQTQIEAADGRSRVGQRRQSSKVVADDTGHFLVQSVATSTQLRGYLGVESGVPLSAPERLLVAHAVSLISIELAKPAKLVDAESRLRSAVTRSLLSQSEDFDIGLLHYFGFDAESEITAVVLTNTGPLLAAERQAASVLAGASAAYLMTSRGNDLVVVVPAERDSELSALLYRDLEAQLHVPVACGSGLPTRIFEVARSTHQALIAARSATLATIRCVQFADLDTFSLLLSSLNPADVRSLSESMLAVLDAHDDEPNVTGGLVDTLAVFLRHNGHIEATSAALGIHRHTIRKRLNKISELTGRDLDSAHVRAELWIAVTAREIALLGPPAVSYGAAVTSSRASPGGPDR